MSKYDKIKVLLKTKARTEHICKNCGGTITAGEYYYKEKSIDKYLQILNPKKYCADCFIKLYPQNPI